MFETNRFGLYMNGSIQIWKPQNMYVVNYMQGDPTYGDLLYVDKEENIEHDDNGNVWGIVGFSYDYNLPRRVIEGGVMVDDVLLDYTKYMKMETAALKIQRTWRKIRTKKAIECISNAWKRYLVKKNELWNLRSFVGVAFLHIEAVKATRDSILI